MTAAWVIRRRSTRAIRAGAVLAFATGLCFAGPAYTQTPAQAPAAGTTVETGTAIASYWVATPAEYAATAEAILGSVGAVELRRGSVVASATAELLAMFAGGGGAPQDVIKVREEYSASVEK